LAGVAHPEETIAALDHVLNHVSRSPTLFRLAWEGDGATIDLATLARDDADLAELALLFAELSHAHPFTLHPSPFTLPPLRADWLVVQLSRPPYYYRAAGVPATRAEWEKLLGLDSDAIADLAANRGANLFRSGITRKPRRISRWQGPLGGAWNTYDIADSSLLDKKKDPIRDPTFDVRFDAGEHIAAKANGLHLFALFDAAGARQDAVPPEIAHDTSEPLGDALVTPMISCVRCHVEDGLRPFADDESRLLSGPVALHAHDPELLGKLAAFYGRETKLQREATRDREDYAEAVELACGLAPKEAAAALALVVREYQYELVTPATARRELGLPADADLAALFAHSLDPILLALASGIAVQRGQWELSYREASHLQPSAFSLPCRRPPHDDLRRLGRVPGARGLLRALPGRGVRDRLPPRPSRPPPLARRASKRMRLKVEG
jgi:hypothetical protein